MYYDGTDSAGAFLTTFFTTMGILIIIILAIAIVQIIGLWKLFKKAGKPGWGSLIPVYNSYLLCQIAGISPWWVLITTLSPILSFIPVLGSFVVAAISIYFSILLNVSLARSFGKESGFAVGLILLPPVFNCILGFGSSKYIGPNPMKDFIFDRINNKSNNSSNINASVEPVNNTQSNANPGQKYCTSCGNQVNESAKYCPKCGSKID